MSTTQSLPSSVDQGEISPDGLATRFLVRDADDEAVSTQPQDENVGAAPTGDLTQVKFRLTMPSKPEAQVPGRGSGAPAVKYMSRTNQALATLDYLPLLGALQIKPSKMSKFVDLVRVLLRLSAHERLVRTVGYDSDDAGESEDQADDALSDGEICRQLAEAFISKYGAQVWLGYGPQRKLEQRRQDWAQRISTEGFTNGFIPLEGRLTAIDPSQIVLSSDSRLEVLRKRRGGERAIRTSVERHEPVTIAGQQFMVLHAAGSEEDEDPDAAEYQQNAEVISGNNGTVPLDFQRHHQKLVNILSELFRQIRIKCYRDPDEETSTESEAEELTRMARKKARKTKKSEKRQLRKRSTNESKATNPFEDTQTSKTGDLTSSTYPAVSPQRQLRKRRAVSYGAATSSEDDEFSNKDTNTAKRPATSAKRQARKHIANLESKDKADESDAHVTVQAPAPNDDSVAYPQAQPEFNLAQIGMTTEDEEEILLAFVNKVRVEEWGAPPVTRESARLDPITNYGGPALPDEGTEEEKSDNA